MRWVGITLALIIAILALGGCASERTQVAETKLDQQETWAGTVTIPLPEPQPDGSYAMQPRAVGIDMTRTLVSLEASKAKEDTLTRVDVEEVVKAAMSVAKPVVMAATGNWMGTAAEVGGWILAAVGGGAAVRGQLKNGTLTKAFAQTVQGISEVRASMGDTEWKSRIAPHLEKAQDEDVRGQVRRLEKPQAGNRSDTGG